MSTGFVGRLGMRLDDSWRFQLTPGGRWLMVAGIASGSLGTLSLEIPVFAVFLSLFFLGFVAWIANFFMGPRVRVEGAFPTKATAGEPIAGTFTLVNTSRRTCWDVGAAFFLLPRSLPAAERPQIIRRFGKGERVAVSVELRPLRRGLYALPPLRVFSSFPFGICRKGWKVRVGNSLLVLPRFAPLTAIDIPIGRRYQPGGIALSSDVGESPEYIGNREYRPGDPLRRIDFRSWARLARPVVREFQEEYYCRVALVLDTYVGRRLYRPRRGFPQLEAAIGLTAGVADAMSRGEYIIDLFAAGPELYTFRAGRHTAHFENVLEILACVDDCRSNPFDTIAPALTEELKSISAVVCILLDWDGPRERLARAAAEAGCSVKLIIVHDGDTQLPVAQAAAVTEDVTQLTVAAARNGGLSL